MFLREKVKLDNLNMYLSKSSKLLNLEFNFSTSYFITLIYGNYIDYIPPGLLINFYITTELFFTVCGAQEIYRTCATVNRGL